MRDCLIFLLLLLVAFFFIVSELHLWIATVAVTYLAFIEKHLAERGKQ